MESKSIKKFSVVGIILMIASATASAFISNSSRNEVYKNGTLREYGATNDGLTCCPNNNTLISCTYTQDTLTTAHGCTVDEEGRQTYRNTSAYAENPDASSILV